MTDEAVPPQPSEEAAPQTFSTALVETIKRISDQLLLYVLAGAMIVAGAAVWGPESLRTLVVPLLVLLLAGLVGWILYQAFRIRSGKSAILQNVKLGPFTKVVGGIKHGTVRGGGRGGTIEQNVDVGPGGRVEGGITHGDIDTRGR
jgi:hypothetical protein